MASQESAPAQSVLKVVVSERFGGFGLSAKAVDYIRQRSGGAASKVDSEWHFTNARRRHDPALVDAVETLGVEANSEHSRLVVKQIPRELVDFYRVHDYDGYETLQCNWPAYMRAELRLLVHANAAVWRADLESVLDRWKAAVPEEIEAVGDDPDSEEERSSSTSSIGAAVLHELQ